MSTGPTALVAGAVSHCSGCGRPVELGDHSTCARRQRATDPPRFCRACGRKLVVQVLPFGFSARCVRCGPLESRA